MTPAENLSALLDQTGWIHALARKLVADPHLAADLAQDTVVDALERGPEKRGPVRGWLATVMRNNLLKLRRGDRNRAAREEAARRSGLEPSSHDVVERAETHRNVVLAVLALDEPYRSTLLMRFFEHHSYDEIARRTGVTSAAVNSRVTRGLAELRVRLENTYGGDRRALCLALLPLAKLPTGVATTILGVKLMHAAIGTAAASLLAVTLSVTLTGNEREAQAPALVSAPSSPESSTETTQLQKPELYQEPREESALAPDPAPQQRERVKEDDRDVWKTELFSNQLLPATVQSLMINTSAGDVELQESLSNQLEIVAKIRARLDVVSPSALTQAFQDHVDVFEEKGALHIEDKHKNERGWSVSFVVSVPAKLSVAANTGSGDVRIRTGQGKIAANTGSGDVQIDLARERVQTLAANTGSGDVVVEVSSVEGKLAVNTGSGDVLMRIVEAASPGSAAANTGSGNVLLVLPPAITGTLELETGSGEIELPRSLGIEVKKIGGQTKAKGVVGNGSGRYQVASGSGDLKVELGNSLPVRER